MTQVERFTTCDVEPAGRLAYWNMLAQRTYPPLHIDSPHPNFRAEMLRWRLGDLMLIQPRSEAATIHRSGDASAGDRVILHLQNRALVEQVHRGRTVTLRPGDLSLCASCEPYRLTVCDDHAT